MKSVFTKNPEICNDACIASFEKIGPYSPIQEMQASDNYFSSGNYEFKENVKYGLAYYSGLFLKGKEGAPTGVFRKQWNNGPWLFEGYFEDGDFKGLGRRVVGERSVYEGEWMDKCFHGKGVETQLATGIKKDGNWHQCNFLDGPAQDINPYAVI